MRNYLKHCLRALPLIGVWLVLGYFSQGSAQTLTIRAITWDVIGLDSNKPTTQGPNTFPVGARVCNTGSADALNLTATFSEAGTNSYITPVGSTVLSTASIPFGPTPPSPYGTGSTPLVKPNNCFDFYFNVQITRDDNADNTSEGYQISVTSSNASTVSRSGTLYVENLNSQGRNAITSITGPANVMVGGTYTYTLISSTAPGGYEQIESVINFPYIQFQVLESSTTYTTPTNGQNSTVWGDACGWSYSSLPGSCAGPANYSGGKAGDTLTTTFKVKILSAGDASLTATIYDYSGSSFHYNSDHGDVPVAARTWNPPAVTKSFSPATVAVGVTSRMSIVITNNNAFVMPGIAFTDTYPSGMINTSSPATNSTCGGTVTATAGGLSFSGGSIPANGTCTVSVNVTSNSAGSYENVLAAGAVTTSILISGSEYVRSTAEAKATLTVQQTIAGRVFEDINYGGGAGRTYAVSNASAQASGFAANPSGDYVGVGSAMVELYDSSGRCVANATTDSGGSYSFTQSISGDFWVRVVNSSVPSLRTGWVNTLIPVQTFRTDGDANNDKIADADTTRVGGETPEKVDASAATCNSSGTGTLLSSLTTISTTAQSLAVLPSLSAGRSGIDFGFNFDTIVNTNNSGQGSLRQFILNANALANTSLSQAGQTTNTLGSTSALTAGKETSLFMISDGLAHPGLRAGLTNQLSGGVAQLQISSTLPTITGADTTVDGGTQTYAVGNTNSSTLGTGGSVGTDGTRTISTLNGPEVQLQPSTAVYGTLAAGITLGTSNITVQNIAIRGFGLSGSSTGQESDLLINAGATGALIRWNVVGSGATSFSDPGSTARTTKYGVYSSEGSLTVQQNLIGYVGYGGIELFNATSSTLIEANELRGNAVVFSSAENLNVNSGGGVQVIGNLSTASGGPGFDTSASSGSNTFENNTVTNNGLLTNGQTSGIRLNGDNNLVRRNVIAQNYGAGVLVRYQDGSSSFNVGNRISENSIYSNGSVSGQIGIDLLSSSAQSANSGTSPFVTLNDTSDADSGANDLLNFPVFESAEIQGTNLVIKGWARPGALIELFISDSDPSGFGEGQTYLISRTEGSSTSGQADGDATSSTYGPGAVNGIVQGQDTTNRFSFTIPLSSLASSVVVGSKLTATATCLSANGCSSASNSSTSEFSGTVTVAASGVSVSGNLYHDLQPNTAREPTEDWSTGTSVYVNLVQSGSVVQSVQVNAGTGAYSFSSVAAGSYSIIVTNTAASVTATAPTGWLFINPSGSLSVSVSSSNISGQDFGLYHGSRFSGTVFYDDGLSSGTANDALQNGGEPGIGNLTVTASDGSNSVSTITGGSGSYTLYVPYTFGSGLTLSHSQNPATGSNISGGSVVLASGFNDALARQRSISFASGQYFDGYNFGVVRPSAWKPNRSGQVTSPGTITYSHLYQPGTLGTLSLSESGGDFSYEIRLDANCNGSFEPSEAFQTSLSLTVDSTWPREGDGSLKTCAVEVRVNVAAGEPDGTVDIAQIVADLTWAGNTSVVNSRTLTDTTTVVEASTLQLSKEVRNVTQGTGFASNNQARPGDVLEYKIYYQNIGTQPLFEVELSDPVPFYSDLEPNVYSGNTEVQLYCPGGSVVNIETGSAANIELDLALHCTLSTAAHPSGSGTAEALLPGEGGYFLYRVRVR